MLDTVINVVTDLGHWAYLIIFLAVCLESAAFLGFFMPGETLVFLGGFLAAEGLLDARELVVLVAIAAILGDCIGYGLGRKLGRSWLLGAGHRFRLGEKELSQVDRFFQRHGGKTVFLARFSVLLRVMVPFLAGAARLPYRQFFFYNVLGGILWSVGAVLVGYFARASWRVAEHWIGRTGAIVGGLVFVAVAVWLVVRRTRSGR